jgi:hypothetical protein
MTRVITELSIIIDADMGRENKLTRDRVHSKGILLVFALVLYFTYLLIGFKAISFGTFRLAKVEFCRQL